MCHTRVASGRRCRRDNCADAIGAGPPGDFAHAQAACQTQIPQPDAQFAVRGRVVWFAEFVVQPVSPPIRPLMVPKRACVAAPRPGVTTRPSHRLARKLYFHLFKCMTIVQGMMWASGVLQSLYWVVSCRCFRVERLNREGVTL